MKRHFTNTMCPWHKDVVLSTVTELQHWLWSQVGIKGAWALEGGEEVGSPQSTESSEVGTGSFCGPALPLATPIAGEASTQGHPRT